MFFCPSADASRAIGSNTVIEHSISAGRPTSEITFEEVTSRFHLTCGAAAEEFGLGITVFKKLCRELGIHRWPYKPYQRRSLPSASATPPHTIIQGQRVTTGFPTKPTEHFARNKALAGAVNESSAAANPPLLAPSCLPSAQIQSARGIFADTVSNCADHRNVAKDASFSVPKNTLLTSPHDLPEKTDKPHHISPISGLEALLAAIDSDQCGDNECNNCCDIPTASPSVQQLSTGTSGHNDDSGNKMGHSCGRQDATPIAAVPHPIFVPTNDALSSAALGLLANQEVSRLHLSRACSADEAIKAYVCLLRKLREKRLQADKWQTFFGRLESLVLNKALALNLAIQGNRFA
jgi:hypothetical protein